MKAALLAGILFVTVAFKPALPGYEFAFPRDHGSHPEYKTEWWYYTGHLRTGSGKRYGFEVTFFRVGVNPVIPSGIAQDATSERDHEPLTLALSPQAGRGDSGSVSRQPLLPSARGEGGRRPDEEFVVRSEATSSWDLRHIMPAHFAITDVGAKSFRYYEKLNRASPYTAGAAEDHLDVFNEGWSARSNPDGSWRLVAKEGKDAIDLTLRARKAPAVHGENGVSVKAQGARFASHYYSMTRMEASGTVNGQRASGQAWMDHEFGSSALRESQQGWDWFSIQLDNEAELMLYVIRRTDGSPDVTSSGSLITSEGNVIHLRREQMRITPLAKWKSPKSGATYPVRWRVELPSLDVALDVRPVMEAQELITHGSTRVTYWEGACDVTGTFGGSPVRGDAYVEMTGYDKAFRAP
jgi:predicted secreted hydrolase